MQSEAFTICFCGDQVNLYAITFKPVLAAELICAKSISADDDSPSQGATQQIVQEMLDRGYQKQPILVGLDCFQALLVNKPDARTPAFTKASNLAVLLEESCPVDAENMIAIDGRRGQALIAIRDRIEPLIDLMHRAGINVQFVVPTALLVARTLQQRKQIPPNCELVIGDAHQEAVTITSGIVANWSFGNGSSKYLPSDENPDGLPRYSIGQTDGRSDTTSDLESTGATFESVLADGTRLAIEKRFDPELVSLPSLCKKVKQSPIALAMQLVGVATAFLLASIIVTNLWQSQRINNLIAQIDDHVNAMHAEAFPNGPTTRLVQRALKTKCEQLSKQTELLNQTESTNRIINSVYVILESMPGDYSIRLNTIQINKRKLVLTGTAESLANVDELKARLEDVGFSSNQSEQEYGTTFKLSYVIPEKLVLSIP